MSETEAAEPRNILDELILEGGGDAPEIEEYLSSTGRVFRFQVPRDAEELSKISRRVKTLASRDPRAMPEAWRPYLPVSPDMALQVVLVEECLIEPKLSTLQALQWAKRAGAYFMEISWQIRTKAFAAHAARDVEAIDDLGEGFGETI